ncbi:related to cystathionine beta-synthase [Cephalotrichum gorgonifer]|uniref:Related to cystathionine beta-synthase n=1 Tax=Cephalotrichum gorgonifer TaxID=2041049 RepID=A0AAE8MPZ4_9PEZI|nr:related to cystathionine beta-synthase [Cephalotrichum gorgonifer]
MATQTAPAPQAAQTSASTPPSVWSSRYRGATVEDLDPPAALSLNPHDPISLALASAYEREYTHLTVVSASTRSLLGYVSIPRLHRLLEEGAVKPGDEISSAMTRFQRKGKKYTVITMQTPLEDLEAFFRGEGMGAGEGDKEGFAVITDDKRRFVLGVATVQDLEEFVKRRPA